MADNKRIVLIGAGNVATHLGLAFQAKGHEVLQVYSRTMESASVLASQLNADALISLEDVCRDADVYIVALRDDALLSLVPSIVKGREEAFFVHTAGSVGMDVWKGHATRYGVLYPMQTFSKARAVDFSSVSFFVEASGVGELVELKDLAASISPKVYEATSAQRSYLHIAAVFACNFANHMYALSEQLLEKHGLPFDAMLPLIDETARKVHGFSPKKAQTGPAVRNDEHVMEKHLVMLEDDEELQELYRRISKSIKSI